MIKVFVFLTTILYAFNAIAESDQILDEILFKYNKLNQSQDSNEARSKEYFKLDIKLRDYLKSLEPHASPVYGWKKEYSLIGLRLNHWSSAPEYYGDIIKRAYSLNPMHNREYTLFAEIHSDEYCWVGKKQYLKVALEYVGKYPDGPYITDVYYNLGGLYWSLYNDLSDLINSNVSISGLDEPYMMEYIFLPHIKGSELTLAAQKANAKANALKFWSLYLEKETYNKSWVVDMMKHIEFGGEVSYGAFSCPD